MDYQVLESRLEILQCPACKIGTLKLNNNVKPSEALECFECNTLFPIKDNYVSLVPQDSTTKAKLQIKTFWNELCKEWYSKLDETLTSEILYDSLEELEKMFRVRKHLAVTEMDLSNLKGKNVLEIGSGGGGHSALFKRYGAHVTSLDISEERVTSTAKKLSLVKEGTGIAILADAENLPFANNSFDIVYSNGVLHHSENTDKCIDEVHRVLKPKDGKAIIMLYCRDSTNYYLHLIPKAIILGTIFRPEPERLGLITEGRPKAGARNPITRVYSRNQIFALFENFKVDSLRKNGFFFTDIMIPGIGQLRTLIMKITGQQPYRGGIIVYGAPFYAETRLELFLGHYVGYCWNIIASK